MRSLGPILTPYHADYNWGSGARRTNRTQQTLCGSPGRFVGSRCEADMSVPCGMSVTGRTLPRDESGGSNSAAPMGVSFPSFLFPAPIRVSFPFPVVSVPFLERL
jgi:hypothetical protein